MLAHPVGGFERITEDDWQEGLYSQPKLDGVTVSYTHLTLPTICSV